MAWSKTTASTFHSKALILHKLHHNMYDIASSTAQIAATGASVGLAIAAVVALVLGGWAALIGLGFFTRKVTHKVTGKKF